MKQILYVASKFPVLSETFIAREMDFLFRRGYGVIVCRLKDSRTDSGPQGIRPQQVTIERSVRSIQMITAGLLWAIAAKPKETLSILVDIVRSRTSPSFLMRLFAIAVLSISYARRLSKQKIDHIRANFLHSEALSAMWLSRLLGVAYSLNVHNAVVLFPEALIQRAVRKARFCTAVSHVALDFASRRRGTQEDIYLVRNGIDLSDFGEFHDWIASSRPPIVLAVGRLTEVKSFETLVEAAFVLRSQQLDFQIRIVGEGPERASLEELIRRRCLQDTVTLLGGMCFDSVKKELSEASMLVVSSRNEGIPTVIIEAMAMGVPVVTTAVGGIPELVTDQETGLLVRPNDPEQLARSIVSLLNHPELGAVMARAARRKIEAEYDIEKNVSYLDSLLKDACGGDEILELTRHESEQHVDSAHDIDVSIIIPCRNESSHIDGCLQSVLAFRHASITFEVIVVDGMSEDGTREKLRSWQARDSRISVYDNPKRNTPAALNIGILHAAGKRVLRLDAHSEYPPEYLQECVAASIATEADNVGGHVITLSHSNELEGKIVQALTTHRFGVGDSGFRLAPSDGPADTVPYGCFRREVFEKIGKFDERLLRNQDYEFNRRILAAGGRIWRSKKVSLRYYNQGSVRGLLKQAYTTALWNPWMWYVAPYTFAYRHLIPALFVCALLACFEIGIGVSWLPLSVLLLLYGVPACVSSIQQASRYGAILVWLLPFMFFSYHVAYGVGILWGTVRLLFRSAPVQRIKEPWLGAGRYRAWPYRQRESYLKRATDISLSALGLVLLLPLMVILGCGVILTSRGPIIYSQIRVGKGGQLFRLHKFRSMVSGADQIGDSITTSLDGRITWFGRFLRRTKLDELPQLWNVLIGEMSLVGPRPDVPEIVAQYTDEMRRIFDVKPGITSIASLALRHEERLLALARDPAEAYEQLVVSAKVMLAMEHVQKNSYWYDMGVLFRTLIAFFPFPWRSEEEHELVRLLKERILQLNKRRASQEELIQA